MVHSVCQPEDPLYEGFGSSGAKRMRVVTARRNFVAGPKTRAWTPLFLQRRSSSKRVERAETTSEPELAVSPSDETIAKISDFGLAHVMHMHDVPTSGDAVIQQGGTLTQLGTVMGTPGFMSPEQLQGRVIDARSDLYSLGITAHVLLFHAFPDPEGIPHLSVGDDLWLPWVERLLRTDPDQRFSSAEDAKAALDEVVGVRLPPG